MRFHVVSLPHTQTTHEHLTCAYTQKVVKFSRMMTEGGHDVFLYSGEENNAICTEHIPCISEKKRAALYGDLDGLRTTFSWDSNHLGWRSMKREAVKGIKARMEERDILCIIGGWAQKPIADELPLQVAEWGVGYEGIFDSFRAFESYAWMHHVYGKQGVINGVFYDAVIPNFFDLDDFEVGLNPDPYLLFIGRLVHRKGPQVAAQIAERAGMPLKVAGPGGLNHVPGRITCDEVTITGEGVEYVGEANLEQRKTLLANAAAVIVPTLYIEPFGGVAVEAMLSGAPVVATDFGAFTETVVPGLSGQRFHTLQEGADAVAEVLEYDRAAVAKYAQERYSLEAIRPQYERWFGQISGLWGKGWDA